MTNNEGELEHVCQKDSEAEYEHGPAQKRPNVHRHSEDGYENRQEYP